MSNMIASGNFRKYAADNTIWIDIKWYQFDEGNGNSTIYADLIFHSKYYWGSYAIAGSYLNNNGTISKLSSSKNIAGTGDRAVFTGIATKVPLGTKSINISGSVVLNGTYNGHYISSIDISGTAELKGESFNIWIKTDNGYVKAKEIWVKTDNGYVKAKGLNVKTDNGYK